MGQIKSAKLRIKLFKKYKNKGFCFPVLIHADAYVSKYSSVGEGTLVGINCIINANCKIGCNTIINNKSLIEHDTTIGNNCHISTGTIINGNCILEIIHCGSGSMIITYPVGKIVLLVAEVLLKRI